MGTILECGVKIDLGYLESDPLFGLPVLLGLSLLSSKVWSFTIS